MKLVEINSGWLAAMTLMMLIVDIKCNNEGLPRSFLRTKRALNPIQAIRNWWSGSNTKQLVPLEEYPLWKVHKYNGISLNPVAVVDSSSSAGIEDSLPEISGQPPPIVKVSHPTYSAPNDLEPPRTQYDPPSYTAAKQYEAPLPVYSLPEPTYTAPNEYGPPTPVYQGPQPTYSLSNTYGPPNNQIEGGVSGNNADAFQISNVDVASEADSGAALNALDSLGSLASFLPDPDSGSSGGLDLATLAKIATSLPDGSVEKLVALLDLYNAKNNQQRLSALSDAASATIKLKAGAANTAAHLVEDVLLGSNGDKGVVAIESGTYANVPSDYPGKPALLPMIPPFSGTSRNILLPNLPEPPPLPAIPFLSGLKDLISPPRMPYIYLPSTYTLPSYKAKGPYVSIRLPKPVTTYNVPNEPLPTYETPLPSYETPLPSYETPLPSYEAPTAPEQISDIYQPPYPESLPAFNEVQTYGPPTTAAPIYGAPVSSGYSVSHGDYNTFQPSGYVGEVHVAETYGAPNVGFDHNTYSPKKYSSPSTAYHAPNDVEVSASEQNGKISRSAQELNTGYSRVVLQNRPAKSIDNSATGQQDSSNLDLRMYLDRNHPASTQQMHEQQTYEAIEGEQEATETKTLDNPNE